MEHIVIIGNGIAGITTARHVRKFSEHRITVISAESDYFFSRTALMYVYMGHMKFDHLKPYEDWFWKENRIELKKTRVEKIEFEQKLLHFSVGEPMSYDKLVLATGSIPSFFGWEGQDLKGVQGLVSLQDLQLLEENTKNCKSAVIVGGGLIGVELAEMLRTRKIPVTFLVRESGFWGNVLPEHDAALLSELVRSHGVDLRHNTSLEKILADDNGRARAVITTEGDEIPCDVVGICTGVRPNIDFLKNSELQIDRGILVDQYLQTNIPDVYAIGDCAQQRDPQDHRNAIEAVWYVGRMMGEVLGQTLSGNKMPYKPGHWFNSAKFFDIEYQTYGKVGIKLEENQKYLHWVHADKTKFMTLVYDEDSGKFVGINTYGIRMRHEVFDRWLTEERSISHVLANLKTANFDPEFYDRHEKEIYDSFREEVLQV